MRAMFGEWDPTTGAAIERAVDLVADELWRARASQPQPDPARGNQSEVPPRRGRHRDRPPGPRPHRNTTRRTSRRRTSRNGARRRRRRRCAAASVSDATRAKAKAKRAPSRWAVPLVSVLIDYQTLSGELSLKRVCELFDGTPISPDTVRRLACDAALIPMVLGSRGEVLDQGRRIYLPTDGATPRRRDPRSPLHVPRLSPTRQVDRRPSHRGVQTRLAAPAARPISTTCCCSATNTTTSCMKATGDSTAPPSTSTCSDPTAHSSTTSHADPDPRCRGDEVQNRIPNRLGWVRYGRRPCPVVASRWRFASSQSWSHRLVARVRRRLRLPPTSPAATSTSGPRQQHVGDEHGLVEQHVGDERGGRCDKASGRRRKGGDSTDPGAIFGCRTTFGGGGASARGPWFNGDGTYDLTAKIVRARRGVVGRTPIATMR